MRPRLAAAVTAVALLAAGSAGAQTYLPQGAAPDSVRILPPPPARGSRAQAADTAAFKATRRMKGQPRWAMATADAQAGPKAGLDDFACALGARLDEANAPILLGLLTRVGRDARAMIDPPKDHFGRKRPFVGRKAEICVPHDRSLDESASYPSGHATMGWTWALILAELAPDRATEVLMRGRAYGESRVVCGVHYPSDVEAGRTTASGLVAALHGDAAFRADMDRARVELAAARAAAPPALDPARCALEAEAGAHRPWD